jgi:hypothetical protein
VDAYTATNSLKSTCIGMICDTKPLADGWPRGWICGRFSFSSVTLT